MPQSRIFHPTLEFLLNFFGIPTFSLPKIAPGNRDPGFSNGRLHGLIQLHQLLEANTKHLLGEKISTSLREVKVVR